MATVHSLTLHPGSNRAVFVPINSHPDTAGKAVMSFLSDSNELENLDQIKINIRVSYSKFINGIFQGIRESEIIGNSAGPLVLWYLYDNPCDYHS